MSRRDHLTVPICDRLHRRTTVPTPTMHPLCSCRSSTWKEKSITEQGEGLGVGDCAQHRRGCQLCWGIGITYQSERE